MSDKESAPTPEQRKVEDATQASSAPSSSGPAPQDNRLAQAVLRRKIQRRVVQRAAAGDAGIKLDDGSEDVHGHVHSPDASNPKGAYQSSKENTAKDSPHTHGHGKVDGVVGLTPEGMQAPGERRTQPTTVRVVLERFEEIHSAFLSGGVAVLGQPEATTLIEGDRLQVYCWGTNMSKDPNEHDKTAHKKSLAAAGRNKKAQIGFVPNPALASYLKNITISQAPGVNSETAVPIPKGYEHPIGGAIFGMTINPGAQGGFVLEGEVGKTPGKMPLHAQFTQAIHQAGDKTANPHDVGSDEGNHDYGKLHEQGSFYGDLHGEHTLKAGQEVVIAAPGSTAYHQHLDRANHVGDRAAAYWVPIQVMVHADAGLKGIIFQAPDSVDSAGTGAGEGDIDVEVPGLMERKNLCAVAKEKGTGRPAYSKFTVKTREISAAQRGTPIAVNVLFRGSCATMIYMKGY